MNQRKARELRKSLGMTKENLRTPDYTNINPVTKIVYFKDSLGNLNPVKATRSQVINRNKFFYRQEKKKLRG